MSKNSNHHEVETCWYLRTGEGEVYGPADTGTLISWYLDGRIEPDNQLSQDGQIWVDASSVPELEMDWYARLEDGTTEGPFSLALIPTLVENGILPASTQLEHRVTGATQPAVAPATADASIRPAEPSAHQPPTEPPAEDMESSLPTSTRLESLQRSATDARNQLIETRHALHTLRAKHTVLQEDVQRMQDELLAAQQNRQKSEAQLLEQQDRATAAETEIENLKAQLEQMKNHYDRLQIESQTQFEQLDALKAERLDHEQRYKRELAECRNSIHAKTDRMAGIVDVLMHDEDLARSIKNGPPPRPAQNPVPDGEVELLKTTVKQLERQLERERDQALYQLQALQSKQPRRPIGLLAMTCLATASLTLLLVQVGNGCSRRHPDAPPAPPAASENTNHPLAAPPPTAEISTAPASLLDLQPDTSLQPDTPAPETDIVAPPMAAWPRLEAAGITTQASNRFLRITFNEGLFTSATRLSPSAVATLNAIATQLRGQMDGYHLIIEGHTDATPVASVGSRYLDNFALGMARAEAVKQVLIETGHLAADATRTASAGDSSPPFPNDTEANRMRNRTVTLTLTRR